MFRISTHATQCHVHVLNAELNHVQQGRTLVERVEGRLLLGMALAAVKADAVRVCQLDAGMQSLAHATQLAWLDVRQTSVSYEAVMQLQQSMTVEFRGS